MVSSYIFSKYNLCTFMVSFQSIGTCQTKYCKSPYTRGNNNHTLCEYCGIGEYCGSSICQYGLTDVSTPLFFNWSTEMSARIIYICTTMYMLQFNIFSLKWLRELLYQLQGWLIIYCSVYRFSWKDCICRTKNNKL